MSSTADAPGNMVPGTHTPRDQNVPTGLNEIGVFWITLYPFDTVLPGTQKSRVLEYLTYSKRIYNLKADIQGFPTVPGSRTGDKTGPLNFVSAQQCSARTGFNLSLC